MSITQGLAVGIKGPTVASPVSRSVCMCARFAHVGVRSMPSRLLAGRPDEPWGAELRLVVAGVRGAHAPLREASQTFLRHAPHSRDCCSLRVGWRKSRALSEARDALLPLAHDNSPPPRVRADAFDLLMRVCADLDDWQLVQRSLMAWQRFVNEELRAIDPFELQQPEESPLRPTGPRPRPSGPLPSHERSGLVAHVIGSRG